MSQPQVSKHSIPVVDMAHHADPSRRAAFVQALGRGLADCGFVAVQNHGVDLPLIAQAYDTARALFALPVDTKRLYETPENGRQRGYTSFGVEHAKHTSVPDLKEFWHVGRTLPDGHRLHGSGDVPPNLWPEELPVFKDTFMTLFDDMDDFAFRLLASFGEYLGLPQDYFERLCHNGNTVMRLIHYPDIEGSMQGMVRAAAHEDINLITVLPYSSNPGLQILTREGEWLDVTVPPDVMICDTGDMMALLTAGEIPATTHRVVNPLSGDGGRLSIPFFMHPHPDAILDPFRPGGESPILAREFLHARLREIGVA